MIEYYFLANTSAKLTQKNLSKLDYKLEFDSDGYSITSSIGVIYGLAHDNVIKSFYPGRSTGNISEMLKAIDSIVALEFYDDSFIDKWMHATWTEDETNEHFRQAVIKSRQDFGLSIDKWMI